MSFGLTIKREFCENSFHTRKNCCHVAEAFGVLLFCNTFTANEIRISTACYEFAQRLPPLFLAAFSLKFDVTPDIDTKKSGKFLFTMTDSEKINHIHEVLGYTKEHIACHINLGVLEEHCCQQAFVRGAFLAGGSATDPEKSYYLAFSTSHSVVSRELSALLYEKNFQPKLTQRNGHYICYFKQLNLIYGFLMAFSAINSGENLKKIADMKMITSSVNRQVNCDAANLGKAVNAAQEQIQAIKQLEKLGILQNLPLKLQETALLRSNHPDCTLTELAEYFSPPISKSALNHRLRKLSALAKSNCEE